METGTILLNGNPYVVRLPIVREQIALQSEAIRDTSAYLRIHHPKLEPYVFNSWRRGFGTRFIRPGHPEDREGFYDFNGLSMWPHHITFPLDGATVTLPTHDSVYCAVVASAIFNGRLWALMRPPETSVGGNASVIARSLTAATWGGGGNVLTEADTPDVIQAYDMIVAEAKLYAACGILRTHALRYSSDGVTWSAPATTPPPTGNLYTTSTVMLNDQARGARLAYDGVNVVLAIHDETGGEIEVYKSTNGGDTWASVLTRNIQSSGGPTGLKAYLHTDGTIVVYLAAAEGLYLIDIPASGTINAEQLKVFNGNANNGMRMEVHQGSLYIPIDNGNNAPFGMKKLTVIGDQRTIEDVGLDISQGVPDALLGAVRWMRSQGPFLFAAVGGAAASRNPYLLCLTGERGDGWQCVAQGAANDPYSWVDFNGPDMIFQIGGETASGATDPGDTRRAVNQLIPTAGTSGVHTFAGGPFDLQLPDFGGDAPEEAGAFFQAQVEALSLDDDSEFVDVEWGLDGAAPSAPATDVRLTNTTRRANLAAQGVSGRTIRVNLELNAASPLSPRLREFVLLFRKKPTQLERFTLVLDLLETARENQKRPYATLIGELETIRDSVTTVAFVESRETGTQYVNMATYHAEDFLSAPGAREDLGQREGVMTVVLEELV